MKRYIRSAEEPKFYNAHLSEEEMLPRLKLSRNYVMNHVMANIDRRDADTVKYLIDYKAIPSMLSSFDLRNNPYYKIEDKTIQLVHDAGGYRTYSVPYAGSGRFGEGNIYSKQMSVNNEGMIKFGGSDKWLDPEVLKPSTIKTYFFRSEG